MISGLALTYVVHIAEVARTEPAIDKQPAGCMQVSVHTTKMTQEIYTAYVLEKTSLFEVKVQGYKLLYKTPEQI